MIFNLLGGSFYKKVKKPRDESGLIIVVDRRKRLTVTLAPGLNHTILFTKTYSSLKPAPQFSKGVFQ